MTELISYDYPVTPSSNKTNIGLYSVPRRYEETKPAKIQNFTHQRILGIGNQYHRESLKRLHEDKLLSVERAEKSVWQQAHLLQSDAIEKVKNDGKLALELAIEEINKEHGNKLKVEALKVEMMMQTWSIEQIKLERAKGDQRLKAAVKQIEEKGDKQLKLAVEVAREEEKKLAAIASKQLSRKHEAELEAVVLNSKKENDEAVMKIFEQKEKEKDEAVREAISNEIRRAEEQLISLKQEYDVEISQIETVILSKSVVIEQLNMEIAKVEQSKVKLQKYLLETREEFQAFIDRIKFFDDGQSDYLLPSVNMEQFENKSS